MKKGTRVMTSKNPVPLTRIQAGQEGIIVRIEGGNRLITRLAALGIRPAKRVTKISSAIMRGPVTIQVDRTRVAIGFGMANRIIIEPVQAIP